MGKRGRPSGLNLARISEIEKLLSAGIPQEVACQVAGIPYGTFRHWLENAAAGKGGVYADFWAAITRARGKAEASAIAQIRAAGAQDWRAASWWLSHHPATRDRWSDTGAVRKAENDLLATVVRVIEAEIPDPSERHRLLTALVAAGCGQHSEDSEGINDAEG